MIKTNHSTENEDQIDLIELLLKRQAELNALLEITRAINSNVPSNTLMEMLELILKSNLKIGKFRMILQNAEGFNFVSNFGGTLESFKELQYIAQELSELKIPIAISEHPSPIISAYDFFIPVHRKEETLAFVLVGDLELDEKLVNNTVDYIQTLINIIIVALENKKLFKEHLHTERMQQEVALASQVQNMLIPQKLPSNAVLEVSAIYKPHHDIGGDFYDFIKLSEEKVLWCVADVSGKGISAALIMSNFQASLRALVSLDLGLTILIERLNQIVFNTTKGDRFITLFIGIYNKTTRKVNYINAGHNAPLIIQNGIVLPLKNGTTMIGVFEELPFVQEGEMVIERKAIIFNYTDGIVEFDGDEEKALSEKDLITFLAEHKDEKLEEMHQNLLTKMEKLRNYSDASDDMTMLTLRFH